MDIRHTASFKFVITDSGDVIIWAKKKDLMVDNNQRVIVNHTENTWQPGRSEAEKAQDTAQGKIAEKMFVELIDHFQAQSGLAYRDYDGFRTDDFQKHAPVDILLFKQGNPHVDRVIDSINQDVARHHYGIITPATRALARGCQVYLTEVKSSKVPKRNYDDIDTARFKKVPQQQALIDSLKQRDFFVYPHFTRSKGNEIASFRDYCRYVQSLRTTPQGLTPQALESYILDAERSHSCDIYTRIFMDFKHTESAIGYFTGFALKDDFYHQPQIIRMPKFNKSELAIYYAYQIARCRRFLTLPDDERLW